MIAANAAIRFAFAAATPILPLLAVADAGGRPERPDHPARTRPVRGEALGLYGGLSALAGGIGSVLGGWLATVSYDVAFVAAAGPVVVGGGVVLSTGRAGVTTRPGSQS